MKDDVIATFTLRRVNVSSPFIQVEGDIKQGEELETLRAINVLRDRLLLSWPGPSPLLILNAAPPRQD